jgi:hypothetical protein
MFARMSRYNPAAPGIRSPPRIPANVQNGRSRQLPASPGTSSGRINERSSRLLICGFGVRVPGGARNLTWGFTLSGSPREGHFLLTFAPRLLVSPDLVARPGRCALWIPADGYTQRDIYRVTQLEGSHPRGRAASVLLSRLPIRHRCQHHAHRNQPRPATPETTIKDQQRWIRAY